MKKYLLKRHPAPIMNCCFLFLCLFLFSLPCSAQAVNEWKSLGQQHEVKVSYKTVDCHGQRFIALRVENNNQRTVALRYTLMREGAEGTLHPVALNQHLIVDGQNMEGSCDDQRPELFLPLFDTLEEPLKLILELEVIL